ncbi:MAG TPA: right-handed parallel beta-helix repeat-containing protein [Polyangiaceae bacterium]|nr:right-handed parallel beta-helix repeat-containing protein [Polyangiaceae bacterium]
MRRLSLFAFAVGLAVPLHARAETLSVGPQGAYPAPCAAFAAASDGDTIEIDSAGNYAGDVCGITKSQLTIRGKGGLAKIDADGKNAQGKAIWVVQGADTLIENVEFSGAAVADLNGAGIRQEGKNLTVRGCYFHDNENGILAGDSAGSEILIENSEFEHNGAGDGYSHNLYINHIAKLTFRYNWSHRAVIGHLLKSRAAENYVLYNRVTGEDGTSSYELDFPNGGKTYVIGNLIQQGESTDNPSMLAYIEEGAAATNPSHQLYVVNNTFVNARSSGTFLNIAAAADPAVLKNNLFVGAGTPVSQAGALLSNNHTDATPCLVDSATFDYHLAPDSPCVNGGADPGDGEGFALAPNAHYLHPASSSGRASVGTIDIGAYELGGDAEPGGGAGGSGGKGTTGNAGSSSNSAGQSSGGNSSAGSSNAGGTQPSGNAGSSSPNGGTSTTDAKEDSGCGCRVTSTRQTSRAQAWALVALLGLAARRSRQRRAKRYGQ